MTTPTHPAREATATIDGFIAELEAAREDVRLAAGELRVPVPEPGTDASRMMLANVMMRKERDAALSRAAAAEERLSRLTAATLGAGPAERMALEVANLKRAREREENNRAKLATALEAAEARAERLARALRDIKANAQRFGLPPFLPVSKSCGWCDMGDRGHRDGCIGQHIDAALAEEPSK